MDFHGPPGREKGVHFHGKSVRVSPRVSTYMRLMAGKTERKVGTVGPHESRYITLPRDWCDLTGVKKGTHLDLLFNGRILLVFPPPGRGR